MSPSPDIGDSKRGYVIPIGGADKYTDNLQILNRLCELCDDRNGRIAILMIAEHQSEIVDLYQASLTRCGATRVDGFSIVNREEGNQDELLESISAYDGIIITGGNPLMVSTTLGGTAIAKLIRRMNAEGVHVAGTVGGAALMSEHMIAAGEAGAIPRQNGVTLAPGLGLTNNYIIDHNFRQRDRLGRLLTALSYNPFVTGIGLDENTAAFIADDGEMEVIGSGAITVIDPSNLQYSSMGSACSGDPISLYGLQLHILTHGARYHPLTGAALNVGRYM